MIEIGQPRSTDGEVVVDVVGKTGGLRFASKPIQKHALVIKVQSWKWKIKWIWREK